MPKEIVTPEATPELSVLDQATDALRNILGWKRDAADQARVEEERALQPALKQLAARRKAYLAFAAEQHKTLSALRELCDAADTDPALAQIVAPLTVALDGFSRALRSVPTHYAKLTADVANAGTMQELVDAAAAVRYEAGAQCRLPAEPELQAGLDAVEQIGRKVNREIAAYERTQTPAGSGPSHPPIYSEVDFTRPDPGPREALMECDLFNGKGGAQ